MFPGMQGGPLMHIIAAKAVCFKEALHAGVQDLSGSDRGERGALAERIARDGFRLVSGGTDNHLLLVDVCSKGVTGKDAEDALDEAGITVNKNTIPFDQNPPMVASGIRIGTPAVTTRGMKEAEMDVVGALILRALARARQRQRACGDQDRGRIALREVSVVSGTVSATTRHAPPEARPHRHRPVASSRGSCL